MESSLSKPGPGSSGGPCLELNHHALTGHVQGAHFSLFLPHLHLLDRGQCLGIQEGRMDRKGESGEKEASQGHGNASPHRDSVHTGTRPLRDSKHSKHANDKNRVKIP